MTDLLPSERYQAAVHSWFRQQFNMRHKGEHGHKTITDDPIDVRLASRYEWYSDESGGEAFAGISVTATCACGQRYTRVYEDLDLGLFLTELVARSPR